MSLIFPQKILEQHLVVLGKTGAGKSSALRHIVEHLLKHNKRVCIIDPKGDWSGLKTSADGMGPGFPVIGFGEFKEPKATDVPLNTQSGKHVAELIATGNRPCILGFRGWPVGQMVKFWIDFAATLFSVNAGELYLVGDEFHNFAPKGKIMDPEAGKCLHWSNRLLNEGRGLGLVCLIASQRPQKVHNDSLTACETLVAMRVIHKADRDAVKDWIDGCGDMEQGKEVLDSLAGMARGEAFVWSPEIGFGPKRLTFPMFETFDSFAPPQLQKKVSASGWATVNMEAVRTKLASVIEEQKANDPAELKRTIADLKRKLAEAERRQPDEAVPAEPIKIPVLGEKDRLLLDASMATCERTIAESKVTQDELQEYAKELRSLRAEINTLSVQRIKQPIARTIQVTPAVRRSLLESMKDARGEIVPFNGTLPKAERAILRVLANYSHGKSKKSVGVIAGYAHTGGGFNNAVSALRSKGLIEGSDPLRITDDGMAAVGPPEPLPTGRDLLDYWMSHPDLGRAEREILRVLYLENRSLSKEGIAEKTQSERGSPYDPGGGGFNNALSRLRTFELIDGRDLMRCADEFYE